jgi:hypothetical protein
VDSEIISETGHPNGILRSLALSSVLMSSVGDEVGSLHSDLKHLHGPEATAIYLHFSANIFELRFSLINSAIPFQNSKESLFSYYHLQTRYNLIITLSFKCQHKTWDRNTMAQDIHLPCRDILAHALI